MPSAYCIHSDLNLLYMAGHGHCTGDEYIHLNRRAAADPERQPGQDTIIDLREVTALDIRPSEVRRIVGMDRELATAGVYGDYRTVIVVRNETDEIFVRLYNLIVRPIGLPGVQIARSAHEAFERLDMTTRDRQPIEVELPLPSL